MMSQKTKTAFVVISDLFGREEPTMDYTEAKFRVEHLSSEFGCTASIEEVPVHHEAISGLEPECFQRTSRLVENV